MPNYIEYVPTENLKKIVVGSEKYLQNPSFITINRQKYDYLLNIKKEIERREGKSIQLNNSIIQCDTTLAVPGTSGTKSLLNSSPKILEQVSKCLSSSKLYASNSHSNLNNSVNNPKEIIILKAANAAVRLQSYTDIKETKNPVKLKKCRHLVKNRFTPKPRPLSEAKVSNHSEKITESRFCGDLMSCQAGFSDSNNNIIEDQQSILKKIERKMALYHRDIHRYLTPFHKTTQIYKYNIFDNDLRELKQYLPLAYWYKTDCNCSKLNIVTNDTINFEHDQRTSCMDWEPCDMCDMGRCVTPANGDPNNYIPPCCMPPVEYMDFQNIE